MQPKMSFLNEYVSRIDVKYISAKGKALVSTTDSLDVNDHVAEIFDRITELPNDDRLGGHLEIHWKGKRMFAGAGPFYTRESIRLISQLNAEIGQDIYCMCN